jgi:hypothetical protein
MASATQLATASGTVSGNTSETASAMALETQLATASGTASGNMSEMASAMVLETQSATPLATPLATVSGLQFFASTSCMAGAPRAESSN